MSSDNSSNKIVSMIINNLKNVRSATVLLNKYPFSNDSKQRLLTNINSSIVNLKYLRTHFPEHFVFAKIIYSGTYNGKNIKQLFNPGDMLTALQTTTGTTSCDYCNYDCSCSQCEDLYIDGAPCPSCTYCTGISTCSCSATLCGCGLCEDC